MNTTGGRRRGPARAAALLASLALVALSCGAVPEAPRAALNNAMEAGMAAPVPGVFTPLGSDTSHAGFPTATVLPDGRVRLMWREGSSHASADGRIMTTVSTDPTATAWALPEQIVVEGEGDVRDPHLGPSDLSTIDGEMWLTYFISVDGIPGGALAAKSTDGGATFGPPVRIDPNLPYAAISSPVAKIGDKLYAAFYGRKPGESVDSAYAAWSVDNGATWSSARIAVGAPGNAYQEPWVVAGSNGSAVFVLRDGTWKALAARVQDSAGGWSPIFRSVLVNATGNSAAVRAANGRLYLVYRDTQTRAAKLASSNDNGLTWIVERELMPRPAGATSSVGMTYAHPVELGNGYMFCPLGMERSDKDSRIYIGFL